MTNRNQIRTELMRINELLQVGSLEQSDHDLFIQILSSPEGIELYVELMFQEMMLHDHSMQNPCDRTLPLLIEKSFGFELPQASQEIFTAENKVVRVVESSRQFAPMVINSNETISNGNNSPKAGSSKAQSQQVNFSLFRVATGLLLVCFGIVLPFVWSFLDTGRVRQAPSSVSKHSSQFFDRSADTQAFPSNPGISHSLPSSPGIKNLQLNEQSSSMQSSHLDNEPSEIRLLANLHAEHYKFGPEIVGSKVPMGEQFSLRKGDIELEFPYGVKAIVSGPAIYKISSAKRLEVKLGVCSVFVPSQGVGFEVLTPTTLIKDLGTRFEVVVNDFGESDVFVVEGKVKVTTNGLASQLSHLIQTGEAFRFTKSDKPSPVGIDFSSNNYKSRLGDRVISYEASLNSRAEIDRLHSIDVLRDGTVYRYLAQQIIGSDVTSFCSGEVDSMTVLISPRDNPIPTNRLILHDLYLTTGVVNPGGYYYPLESPPVIHTMSNKSKMSKTDEEPGSTPGMKIKFHHPVINSKGPDIVIFEVQKTVSRPEGDRFHLSPVKFKTGLKGITIDEFDLWTTSHGLIKLQYFMVDTNLKSYKNLDELLAHTPRYKHDEYDFYALPVAIDLSKMGYVEGDVVEELFLQDALDDNDRVDPVFIGGLPPLATN